jgi:hypothetical protein
VFGPSLWPPGWPNLPIDPGEAPRAQRAVLAEFGGLGFANMAGEASVARDHAGRRAGAGMALAAARGRVSGRPGRRGGDRIGRVRAISTGQLHGLLRFHLRPIDVVVFHGSRRDLVLRRVSRLDAFSGYPVRT